MAIGYFAFQFLIQRNALSCRHMPRKYRLPPGRKFIEHRHIQVTVHSHGQCARNRRGCHYQNVRRRGAFKPQLGALCHTETVLLVDNHKSQLRKDHVILYNGMRTYKNIHISRSQCRKGIVAPSAFYCRSK